MTFKNKIQAVEIALLFMFWFWLFIGKGADGVATAIGFWLSTAFMVFVNRCITKGFKL